MISTDATVLEIGGGASSQWWLARGNHVTTIESDQEWSVVIGRLCATWSERHRLLTESESTNEVLDRLLGNQSFDIVVNDGSGDRSAIAPRLAAATNEHGLMIWDNSDRAADQLAMRELVRNGWQSLDFFGVGPINAYASKSTIFYRGQLRQSGKPCTFDTVGY